MKTHRVLTVVDRSLPGDQTEVDDFFRRFGGAADFVEIAQPLSDTATPETIREEIRDVAVTLVLNGRHTHARRDVDVLLAASLLPSGDGASNGLLGCTLDRSAQKFDLPDRLMANVKSGYARFYRLPLTEDELAAWIDDAATARVDRADLAVVPVGVLAVDRAPTPTWSPFVDDDGRPRPR